MLDEATSQIDPHSEELIHQALKDFLRHRSGLIITHRMSALDLADQIAVMDRGTILATGSHVDLVGRCELYRRLCKSALQKTA